MAELTVSFDVPSDLLAGLQSGVYERVGGVVRNTGTKKVVAWLRDGVIIKNDTAQQLLQQGAQQTQMLQTLGVQQQMMMGLQVANLAVSVAGFALLYNKLDAVQKSLVRMDAKLDRILQGQERLETKQMLAHLAPVYAGVKALQETSLFRCLDLKKKHLTDNVQLLSEAHSFFYQLVTELLAKGEEYKRPQELMAAYRAWVMAGQGQAQAMVELDEVAVAERQITRLKMDHAVIGKQLQTSLKNPANRLGIEPIGNQHHELLLGLAQQSVGVHEILRGQQLQLEYLSENKIGFSQLEQSMSIHKNRMMLCRID